MDELGLIEAVQRLRLEPGDVVLVRVPEGSIDQEQAERLRHRFLGILPERLRDVVHVGVIAPEVDIAALPEDTMRAAGWVRAPKAEE